MVAPTHRNILNGCSYDVAPVKGAAEMNVKIVGYNSVDGMHTIVYNAKTMRVDMSRYSAIKRSRKGNNKTSTKDVFLYLCDLGQGLYKIGVSASPERRQKQIKTYSGHALMRKTVRIPSHKSAEFRTFEKAVLTTFAHGRTSGGTEVLKLSNSDADACASFMQTICARM